MDEPKPAIVSDAEETANWIAAALNGRDSDRQNNGDWASRAACAVPAPSRMIAK
jgi:hypothetical protein